VKQQLARDFAVDIGQPHIAAAEPVGELFVIDAVVIAAIVAPGERRSAKFPGGPGTSGRRRIDGAGVWAAPRV
jgi:hypothetical protein